MPKNFYILQITKENSDRLITGLRISIISMCGNSKFLILRNFLRWNTYSSLELFSQNISKYPNFLKLTLFVFYEIAAGIDKIFQKIW